MQTFLFIEKYAEAARAKDAAMSAFFEVSNMRTRGELE